MHITRRAPDFKADPASSLPAWISRTELVRRHAVAGPGGRTASRRLSQALGRCGAPAADAVDEPLAFRAGARAAAARAVALHLGSHPPGEPLYDLDGACVAGAAAGAVSAGELRAIIEREVDRLDLQLARGTAAFLATQATYAVAAFSDRARVLGPMLRDADLDACAEAALIG